VSLADLNAGGLDRGLNPCRPFILRPVATLLLAIGLLIFGIAAWAMLPVAALPQVEYPVMNVIANLPGASAETMATSIAAPLERQFAYLNGVVSINSTSGLGQTFVRLQFDLGRNIDLAAIDVQSAISNAAGDLPPDMPNPPFFFKENPAERAMVVMAFTSDVLPLTKVDQFSDTAVVRRISNLPGISRAQIADEQKFAIRVQINPASLASRGLSPEDVRNAIQRATVNRPKGRLEGGDVVTTVESNDQIFDADGLRDIVVAYRNDAPVRLSDVASIEDGVENDKATGWYNGHPAIIIAVQKRPGANTVQAVDGLRAALGTLRASLPPSINLNIVTDRAETIRASLGDVELTLGITIALVVLVIFIFLRHFWATVIPSITIPLSLLATLIVMLMLGFTLDNLSLMALTIAVGFVVDDAIVVIENIVRHMEEGEGPIEAAIKGGGQVAFTILSITLSLVAVFIPVFFMGGIVGRLFREFAATVSVAILASAVVSLTLSPMLCSRLLKPVKHVAKATPNRLQRWSAWANDRVMAGYRGSLVWVLRHRKLTLLSFALTLGLTGYLYATVPKGFFPPQDNGRIFGFGEAPTGTPFAVTSTMVEQMTAAIRADPDVFSVTSYVGGDSDENTGSFVINLKPREERAGVSVVLGHLRERAAKLKGLRFFMQPEPEIITGTDAGRTEYQYTLVDADRDELEKWTPTVLEHLKQVPGLLDVSKDLNTASSVRVVINRDLAARMGVDPKAIDDTLYDAFGPRRVAEIYTDSNQYYVLMQVDPQFQADQASLQLIYVNSAAGKQIPLSTFASFESSVAPISINHRGQFPDESLTFNLAPGVSIGEAVDRIHKMEAELGKPITLQTSFEGAAQEFEKSLASQPWLIAAATLVVYIVLGMLYESFIHPLTILSSLPSAGVGALLALIACGSNLDVMGLIGIILLIGIVKKNAIMMVDFAIQAEAEGLNPEEAILQACLVRFRPIMMTTIAAIFGALPLALGHGAGSELRRPLGIAIVGGLMVSQVLTLYTTPVIHLGLRKLSIGLQNSWRQLRGQPAAAPAE
jgi:hydrophobe/amphiphile efflux-1 (HAE1) family protein